MTMIDKIKMCYDQNMAYQKVGIQQLAHMLGMRQINMLETNDQSRRYFIHYLICKMNEQQIKQQLQVGKEFICGYRPGIIKDASLFDVATQNARFSEKNRALVKKVLVDGIPIKNLDISAQQKQIVDQCCITVCRMFASLDKYRKQTAIAFIQKIESAVQDKSLVFFVASCVTGISLASLKSYVDTESSEVPAFSAAAFMVMAKEMLDKDEIQEIEAYFAKARGFLDDVLSDWYFYDNYAHKKAEKIQKALGSDVSIQNLIRMFDKERIQAPSIIDIAQLDEEIDRFYSNTAFGEFSVLNGVVVSNLRKVRYAIEAKKKTLYSISQEFTKLTHYDLTAFYNNFKRWQAKTYG